MSITIEEGRRYVRRDGQITGTLIKCINPHFPWRDKENKSNYTNNGFYFGEKELHNKDIISEFIESTPDLVNQPPHYKKDGMECIDVIKAALTPDEYAGFLKGNAIKYLFRHHEKGTPEQDLQKAQWYINRITKS